MNAKYLTIDANYVSVYITHKYFNKTFDIDLCDKTSRSRKSAFITLVLDEIK